MQVQIGARPNRDKTQIRNRCCCSACPSRADLALINEPLSGARICTRPQDYAPARLRDRLQTERHTALSRVDAITRATCNLPFLGSPGRSTIASSEPTRASLMSLEGQLRHERRRGPAEAATGGADEAAGSRQRWEVIVMDRNKRARLCRMARRIAYAIWQDRSNPDRVIMAWAKNGTRASGWLAWDQVEAWLNDAMHLRRVARFS